MNRTGLNIILAALCVVALAFVFLSCDNKINTISDPHFDEDGTPLDSLSLFSPQSPEKAKLYIETSGSMNGFFRANQSNNFKKTVWSVFSGIAPITDGKVYPLAEGGDIDAPVEINAFRERMNAGDFVSNSSTHVPSMLSSIISDIDTARNEVAVLVSDMKYSPMGKSAAPMLAQYQEQIRNIIAARPDISVAFVCASSEFLIPDGTVAEERSPYYFIILGKSEYVAQMRNNISRWCEDTGSYIESGDAAMDYRTPDYEIRDVKNGLLSEEYPRNLITSFSHEVSDTCSFIVRVNMTGYPWGAVDKDVLKDCMSAKSVYGASIDVDLLDGEEHLVDDHSYKGDFKRLAYADYLIKLYNLPTDCEVVEWNFSNKPFDGHYQTDFNTIITAKNENDLAGSFSFDKFLKGVFNAHQNTSDENPVRILVSSAY